MASSIVTGLSIQYLSLNVDENDVLGVVLVVFR
jgi:hypothetical protein